jgi:hypothetical protein
MLARTCDRDGTPLGVFLSFVVPVARLGCVCIVQPSDWLAPPNRCPLRAAESVL